MPAANQPVRKSLRSAAYTYDELGRLSSALTTGSTGTGGYAQWGLSFTYDRYGNLIEEHSDVGPPNTTCLAVSASTNQVTGTCAVHPLTTYSYDANGNMLKDGANTLTYDAENRTTNATIGATSVADYVYDGNGLRVKKCTPSCSASSPTITVYIYSGSKVIAEYTVTSGTPTLAREYLYAGGLKLATIDTATTYHLRDHLSVRVNTNTSGAIVGEQGHYPFGDSWYLNSTTTKEMFTSYERDPETGDGTAGTGNDFAMARYNVNRLGRFSSIDQLSGNLSNPQSLNHYAYSLNDPINDADPSGMSDLKAVGETGKTCGLDGIQVDCGWIFRGAQGIAGDGGSGSEFFSQCQTATCGGFLQMSNGQTLIFYEQSILGSENASTTLIYPTANPDYLPFLPQGGDPYAASDPTFSPQGTTGGGGGSGCGATQAVSFIKAHQADAAIVAKQLGIPTQNVLGLSGIESTWGTSNIATSANNFFGLHGGANAPFANGSYVTSGGVQMSAFPSYLASAQSFAAQYGSFVSGVVDPTKFAQALVSAGFNPAKLPLGNPNFVQDTARTINATKGRMGCS